MRYRLLPEKSQVWIEGSSTVHPIHATASGVEGWFEADIVDGVISGPIEGRVEIAVDRLRSGNRLVDRETRRHVDAGRHPVISGEITKVEAIEGGRLSVGGVIEFRGESAEVTGDVEVRPTENGIVIEGSQTFDVRDWGLQPPSLMVIRVHPEVRVRISAEAEPA